VRAALAAAMLLLASALLLLGPLAGTAAAADVCESCHGLSGGYAFMPMTVRSTTPKVVAPDTPFVHTVELRHPGRFTALDATVSIDLSNARNVTAEGPTTATLGSFSSGSRTASFALRATATGVPQTIATSVTYTATEHGASAPYMRTLTTFLTIADSLIVPSSWQVDMGAGDQATVDFTASRDVRNVRLLVSPVLSGVAEVVGRAPTSLAAGEHFAVSLSGLGPGTGPITVVYEDASGTPYKLPLDVSVTTKAPRVAPPGQAARWFGAVFGFGSLALLVLSAVIGMPFKPLKRRVNKAFATGAVRTSFHCGVSWVLIALALLHAAVLMYTSWSSSMVNGIFLLATPGANLGTTINLGTIGWTAMLLTGAGGVLTRPVTSWIGHRGWRYTHSAMTLTALLASVFHSTVFTIRLV